LTIHVLTPAETIVQIAPKGYERTPGLIEWRLKDVEPAEDLCVVFDPTTTETYLQHMSKRGAGPVQYSLDPWLASFALGFSRELDQRMGMLYQLGQLAKVAPNYRRFRIPGMEGSETVIEKSSLIMGEIAQKKSD